MNVFLVGHFFQASSKAKKILKKTNSASSLVVASKLPKSTRDGADVAQRKRSGSLSLPSSTANEFQVEDYFLHLK